VGKTGDEAILVIKGERPAFQVHTVPDGAIVTMDFKPDRVRVYVDGVGKVVRLPRVG
jgi:Potato inhibitor I family